MQSIKVVIPDETLSRLEEVAHVERRRPSDQAAILLIEAVDRVDAARATMNALIRDRAGRTPAEPK